MEVNYASINKRFFAHLIDMVVIFIIAFAVGLVMGIVSLPLNIITNAIGVIITLYIHYLIVVKLNGQSIGKRMLKIRIVNSETFEIPSKSDLMKRIVLKLGITNLLALINLGVFNTAYYLFAGIKAERTFNHQTFWDSYANTVVIDA